jgi:MATE family multidrug resistance protein
MDDQENTRLLPNSTENGVAENFEENHAIDVPLSLDSLLRESKRISIKGWPLVVSFFINNSINLSPIFSLGHLGTDYLAAIALTSMFCNITGFAVGIGMASALDTLCSQSFTGSSDRYALGKHLQRGLVIQAVLSIAIIILWFNTEQLLLLLGQDQRIAMLSGEMARWLAIGIFPNLVSSCIQRYLQGQGIMMASFYVMIIAAPINIFMQWAFVWSTFAKIGPIGAPLATSITNIIICGLLVGYTAFIRGSACWGGWELKEMFDTKKLYGYLKLGFPGVLMICSEWWAFEIMALLAGLLGKNSLAAQTVMLQTSTITYLIPMGFAVASANITG